MYHTPGVGSTSLLLGGTFDPVHVGHLVVSRAVAEQLGCSRVVLVPCAQSPHKQGLTQMTPAEHRLAMLQAAVAGDAFFDILTAELERPAPSYTVDTVELLLRQGWQEVHWLIGADQAMNLPRWHRAADLIRLVKFAVACRPGTELRLHTLPPPFDTLVSATVKAPQIEVSSTDIRQRLASGKSVRGLLPDAVEHYARRHSLYRT